MYELGTEKALELHAKAHEDQGLIAGEMLKDKFGDEIPDLQKLGAVLSDASRFADPYKPPYFFGLTER